MQTQLLRFLFLLSRGAGRGWRNQRMGPWASGVAVVLLMLFMAAPASANMATYNVSFTATGFTSTPSGTEVPTDLSTVTGSFTITFDPTVQVLKRDPAPGHPIGGTYTGTIALNPTTLFLGYTSSGSTSPIVTVGGEGYVNSSWNFENQLSVGTNDIYLYLIWGIGTISSPNARFMFIDTEVPGLIAFIASSVDVTVTTVPVPGALVLFGSGLLGLSGWGGFRKS